MTNSTLSGNSAGDSGGGISDSGSASLTYVTVANNQAASGGGLAIAAGSQSAVSSIDSIYQDPQGGSLVVAGGAFQSLGHNLFADSPGVALDLTDLINTDPLLGPLANNGGPTLTQTLLAGSTAMNAGVGVAGITTDQRGASRPTSGPTDIGAVQV